MTDRNPEFVHGGWLGYLFLVMGIALVLGLIATSPAFSADLVPPGDSAPADISFTDAEASAFCTREPAECLRVPGDDHPAPFSDYALVVKVAAMDSLYTYESDAAHYGRREWWATIKDGRGDCEDFALTARHTLIARGIPSGAIRLVGVETWSGGYHMILEVRFDNGEIRVIDGDGSVWTYDQYWPAFASAWGSVSEWRAL
jgi:predicted transglutaminase-like cysteine proteinase